MKRNMTQKQVNLNVKVSEGLRKQLRLASVGQGVTLRAFVIKSLTMAGKKHSPLKQAKLESYGIEPEQELN